MSKINISEMLDLMTKAALAAGEAIIEIYEKPISFKEKKDGSPVTIADEKSEQIILEILAQTKLPVLAEESASKGDIPELGNLFFVVDPIDGTKEFIKKNDEFTVNIALIENGKPICSIITAPALNKGYIGSENGAFSFSIIDGKQGELEPIKVNKNSMFNMVSSRSHKSDLLEELIKKLDKSNMSLNENISAGSSLKFCILASGEARIYPRFSCIYEWDTAAGQAILEAAGGVVLTTNGLPLAYGKASENFLNPFFMAADDELIGKKIAKYMQEIEIKNDN